MGAFVILTGRRKSALEETRSLCSGREHSNVAGDIISLEFVQELVETSGKITALLDAPVKAFGNVGIRQSSGVRAVLGG